MNPRGSAKAKSPPVPRHPKPDQSRHALFPIVGVGPSAGGLEAFTQLLKSLGSGTEMAYVLVQHLDPSHESALPQILAKATEMPVRQVTDATLVQPNHVCYSAERVHDHFTGDIAAHTPYGHVWASHANRSFLTLARGGPKEQCDWSNSFRDCL